MQAIKKTAAQPKKLCSFGKALFFLGSQAGLVQNKVDGCLRLGGGGKDGSVVLFYVLIQLEQQEDLAGVV